MHHWEVGGSIDVGWPDFGMPEVTYEIVEIEKPDVIFSINDMWILNTQYNQIKEH